MRASVELESWRFRCIMKVLIATQVGRSTKTQWRWYASCPKLHEVKHPVNVKLDMDEMDSTVAES